MKHHFVLVKVDFSRTQAITAARAAMRDAQLLLQQGKVKFALDAMKEAVILLEAVDEQPEPIFNQTFGTRIESHVQH